MKLSDKLKADHESGDCGKALEGYSEEAKKLEDLVSAQKVLVDLCMRLADCSGNIEQDECYSDIMYEVLKMEGES